MTEHELLLDLREHVRSIADNLFPPGDHPPRALSPDAEDLAGRCDLAKEIIANGARLLAKMKRERDIYRDAYERTVESVRKMVEETQAATDHAIDLAKTREEADVAAGRD